MIPAFLAPIAAKIMANLASKTTKLIIVGALLALLAGIFFYYKHQIYSNGYNDAAEKYEKRDRETERKSDELLKLKNHEIEIAKEKSRNDYLKALEIYANENIRLTNDLNANLNRRVYVRTKTASCSGDTVSAKAGISKSAIRREQAIDWAELGRKDAATVWHNRDEVIRMALLCKQQVQWIEQNAEVK